MRTTLLSLVVACVLGGCAYNRPNFSETITTPQGVTTVRTLVVPTWALWPATTSLDKQRVTLGKTMSVGTTGLHEDSGGTNMIEALKAIDSILGKVRP